MPTGNPIESMPMITPREDAGQISERRVGVITKIPPTANPDRSLTTTTHSHDGAKLRSSVRNPNAPADNARARDLPILSLINPQLKPPMVQPARYSALMMALMPGLSGPDSSFTTPGR